MAFTDSGPAPGAVATVAGASLGCLFYVLLLFPVVVAAGLGSCLQEDACDRGIGRELLLALAPAILFGAAMRSLLRWLGGLIRAQEVEAEAGPRQSVPWWALAAAPLALGGGTWLVLGVPLWDLW